MISKVESFRGTSLYASFLICTYALAKAASNSCIAFLIFQVLYTMPHATRLPRLGEEQYSKSTLSQMTPLKSVY